MIRRRGGSAPAVLVGALTLGALVGCGSGTVTVEKTAVPPPSATPVAATKAPAAHRSTHHLNNPAQQPDPSVTAYCNQVPLGHACHAVTAAPEDPNVSPQRNCDTNIVANSHTSCGLAENAFYEYYKAHSAGTTKGTSITVHSPTTGKDYELGCEASKGLIGCISTPTSDFIFVTFPEAAINVYTDAQATAYAQSHNVGNPGAPASSNSTPTPSEPTPPSRPESGGSSSADEVGSYSHAGDQAFCEEHQCIGDFEGEGGYVVECSDGTYSHAGGISGSCSHHGGNR
jgi:hypothetical protein